MRKYGPTIILALLLTVLLSQSALAQGPVHHVTWGESLEGIAARYGVSAEAIMRQNGLTNPDFIYVGQRLVIPGMGYQQSPGYGCGSCCGNYHIVQFGETLSSIAWNYNTTVQALLQHNNLYNKDFVYVGQQLCVPGSAGAYAPQPAGYQAPVGYHAPPANYYYHTVRGGETLSTIAYRYGVNYWDIVQANGLSNASYIWSGQRLIIPGYHTQPAPPVYHPAPAPPGYKPGDYGPGYAGKPAPPYRDAAPEVDQGGVPPAPEYKAEQTAVQLPRARRPVEVVVNGGETWVGQVYDAKQDPDGITTLIVQTGEELGKLVRVRSGDSEAKGESEFTGEFGANRFVYRYISPGDYDVWVDDPDLPSQKSQVKIEAGQRVEVGFTKQVAFQGQSFASPDGWLLADWNNPSKPGQNLGGWSSILVKTPASGLWVIIESEGGYQAKCFTGSKGPGACEFAALGASIYFIHIDGTDLTLKTYMDGAAHAEFTFGRQ